MKNNIEIHEIKKINSIKKINFEDMQKNICNKKKYAFYMSL